MSISEIINDHVKKAVDAKTPDLSIFDDTQRITKAFDRAVREALLDHKRAGNAVAVWRDGKVVIVPPEEIDVSESGADAQHSDTQKQK